MIFPESYKTYHPPASAGDASMPSGSTRYEPLFERIKTTSWKGLLRMSHTSHTKTDLKTWIFAILFVILIASSAFLLFYKLDVHYMHYYDESFYGINAYEMVENNDYIVHTYMGEVNDNNIKPPLGLWAIVLCYKIFGFSLFSMRAQSVIAMLLTQIILGFGPESGMAIWRG